MSKSFLAIAIVVLNFVVVANAAEHLDQFGVLVDSTNDIRKVDWPTYTCPEGTHVPSLREFAKESELMGAKGILEISQVSSGEAPTGYALVTEKSIDGIVDTFYYSNKGYQCAPSPSTKCTGLNLFWTNSHPEPKPLQAFLWSPADGAIYRIDIAGAHSALRCFSN